MAEQSEVLVYFIWGDIKHQEIHIEYWSTADKLLI